MSNSEVEEVQNGEEGQQQQQNGKNENKIVIFYILIHYS